MRFLLTGHNGFKGSWLTVMLKSLGHEVYGISIPPQKVGLYNFAQINNLINGELICDILDYDSFQKYFTKIKPDIAIHLAAQSLVLKSYEDPVLTYNTNVFGTLNFLRAVTEFGETKANLIITSDKVYKNKKSGNPHTELDEIGGIDPYSASKAMADILSQSWIAANKISPTSIVRAGNVIGGGDWADNRLIPDIVRAIVSKNDLIIRFPQATRPWQHVLDCLGGYLLLVEKMLDGETEVLWNFGPPTGGFIAVEEVINKFLISYGNNCNVIVEEREGITESISLKLNSTKSRAILGWKDKLDIDSSINLTAKWYRDFYDNKNPLELTLKQAELFFTYEI
jgi:CDP-glucose 4,6-dehydratase